MDADIRENRNHVGFNIQKIRLFLGIKQEALASDLGISQGEVSIIESQDEVEDVLLSRIATVLGVSVQMIKNFDVEKTIFNINHHNYQDANIAEGATTYAITHQVNPIEKIVELYERLLKSEKEKIEMLRNIQKGHF